jgi:hypothetical protein
MKSSGQAKRTALPCPCRYISSRQSHCLQATSRRLAEVLQWPHDFFDQTSRGSPMASTAMLFMRSPWPGTWRICCRTALKCRRRREAIAALNPDSFIAYQGTPLESLRRASWLQVPERLCYSSGRLKIYLKASTGITSSASGASIPGTVAVGSTSSRRW